jgi:hypothetical protein
VTVKYLKYGRSHKFFPGIVSNAESEFYKVETKLIYFPIIITTTTTTITTIIVIFFLLLCDPTRVMASSFLGFF